MTLPSLLAVFAHPDDESLAAGGVLARHAAGGARTAVVTATWAPETRRAAELADALRVLGAEGPRLLGYADARAPQSAPGSPRFVDAPLDEVVHRLVVHIRQFCPDIVVTHDAYGNLTGHPDHLHAHRVTTLAVQAAALDQLYPDAGAPWRPSSLYLATHPHSAARVLGQSLVRQDTTLYSVPDESVTVTVDVGPWLEQKISAILAHRSEVERGALPGRLASLAPAERARLLSTEWYVRHDPHATEPARTDL
ncbi:PIG-L deacetylase family protein [Streptomyces aurantiacus]|uniref:Putative 1D-myo-inositol 2-acetamido-2-deoxy-alpha-D-glucopyranoside deacetylase n=1 Tax=Streptomyces aurantiacus JA 4570 TaxID=1286094 RepID=S3ZDZ9_9ACTN|nr:PIG-L deacetylase family protein [Streptomyces aurantiacus]EPH41368.1 putative 1D-myo-inositol 2-acetamido-2-deoxy-alpha-D-glucopyranoside deacetylase [Streptomyces aurantiacus JA 4570]